MSSLITYRPQHFNSVVGQSRVIRILTAVLTTAEYLPKGFILEGMRGVGKTSVAYLLARALMCLKDSLGCGSCASCKLIADEGLDHHPDFSEVDGASNSGVDHARNILLQSEALPVLGKRRIVMVDEAHNISRQAWDVYLKPLETKNTSSSFLFVSSEGDGIPKTIRSRCCKMKFQKLMDDVLLGLLCNCANTHQIPYDLDALKIISKHAKGVVREAYITLDTVASMGRVTKELVQSVIDTSLEDSCLKIYAHILKKEQTEAVILCEQLGTYNSPAKVIEAMFGVYGSAIFRPENSIHEAIKTHFSSVARVTTVLIKWSMSTNLPLDSLSLFIYEMIGQYETASPFQDRSTANSASDDFSSDTITVKELLTLTGGNL